MRVAVAGATGKLGQAICAGIEDADDLTLVARIARSLEGGEFGSFGTVEEALAASQVDVLVEVTSPHAAEDHVRAAIEASVPCVIGSTGLDRATLVDLDHTAAQRGVTLFYAPNFAIGAVLMMRFAAEAARVMTAAEIIEEHAVTKVDRPSGTALHTADLIAKTGAPSPPIHSVRLPGVVANQAVVFGASGQTLTIRHETTSREAFVPGVLLALRRIADLPPGLTVGLDTLL
jgi:4-hydroxy-tetrahydrodipicolinate reductase